MTLALMPNRQRGAGDALWTIRSPQFPHRAGPGPGVAGFLDERGELAFGVAARAVDGLGRPALTATVSVEAEIDAQLPRVVAPLAHRTASPWARGR
jgi:hypothetical protein